MRRFTLFMLGCFFCLGVYAQNRVDFTLSTECKYVVPSSDKDYYVFNYEGVSQSELYNRTMVAVTKTFASAKDVVSKVEDKLISVKGSHTFTMDLGGFLSLWYKVDYVLEFEFKEGRMKINAPTIVQITNRKGEHPPLRECILTTSGNLASGWENYLFVNDVINTILDNITTTSQEENW